MFSLIGQDNDTELVQNDDEITEEQNKLLVIYEGLQKIHVILKTSYEKLQQLTYQYDEIGRTDENLKSEILLLAASYLSLKKIYEQRLLAYNELCVAMANEEI